MANLRRKIAYVMQDGSWLRSRQISERIVALPDDHPLRTSKMYLDEYRRHRQRTIRATIKKSLLQKGGGQLVLPDELLTPAHRQKIEEEIRDKPRICEIKGCDRQVQKELLIMVEQKVITRRPYGNPSAQHWEYHLNKKEALKRGLLS